LYVVDLDADFSKIRVFSPKGEPQGYWRAGAGAIAFGPDGNLYQADGFDGVGYYSPKGSFLGPWRSPFTGGELECPVKLAVGNRTIFFVDLVQKGEHTAKRYYRIKYFTAAGEYLGELECDGSDRFKDIGDIAIAPDGTVYVVDPAKARIQYFRPVAADK
jgi:hypothetical protein